MGPKSKQSINHSQKHRTTMNVRFFGGIFECVWNRGCHQKQPSKVKGDEKNKIKQKKSEKCTKIKNTRLASH